MCRRLEAFFREADVLQRYGRGVGWGGDELYHVRFPFVKRAEGDVRPGRRSRRCISIATTQPM